MTLSWQAHPDEVQLLVAVVNYNTKLVKPRRGLCSTWLASLDPLNKDCRVPVWVKKGTISFPKALDSPIVMVGPGNLTCCTIFFFIIRVFLHDWSKTFALNFLDFVLTCASWFYLCVEHYWIFYRQAEVFKRQHVTILRIHLALQSWRLFSEKFIPHNLCLPHKCAYGRSFSLRKPPVLLKEMLLYIISSCVFSLYTLIQFMGELRSW